MSVIQLEKQGPIAILTLNRPDMMNALGQEGDGAAVVEACGEIEADPAIRCAILTGAGRAFSAGGDVKAMRDRTGAFAGSPYTVREGYRRNIHRIVKSLYNLEVPLIAAVNGAAIGLGCDVACMADVRIASDKAKFGVTFLKLGLIPGDGGAWLLPRIIGASRAAELLFTGDVIDAATAADWGLISRAVPSDTLMDEAMALATRMAGQPPQSL
ncbi:MAG: enoyl-CoA hydratase-related protein, partial [Pseudomonadota bacterium]|nr:enoyl-CoA hydratase-related protein [Pseudomonadota bacterium]